MLKLKRRTPAARFQYVHPGDLLLEVNGMEINSVEDAVNALGDLESEYRYRINRRGNIMECLFVSNRSYRCRSGV